MQNVITHSQKKSEKLKTVVGGHQELTALKRRISDKKAKNCYLEKANSELREQLMVQRKAHEEQLKEQEKELLSQEKPTPNPENNSR
jgi:regulator of replication initiation timing